MNEGRVIGGPKNGELLSGHADRIYIGEKPAIAALRTRTVESVTTNLRTRVLGHYEFDADNNVWRWVSNG